MLQGPQKISGGPHAVRRPHFGHVWNRVFYFEIKKGWEETSIGIRRLGGRAGYFEISTFLKSISDSTTQTATTFEATTSAPKTTAASQRAPIRAAVTVSRAVGCQERTAAHSGKPRC